MTAQPDRPPYQVMPPLTLDEMNALREDIRQRGQILVAVEVDEHGQVLDGHHRVAIAASLGLGYPRIVRAGMTESEKRSHALALNLHRRHLSPQVRAAAVAALRREGWSSRRIAERTGISQSTVVRDLAGDPDGAPDRVVGADGKRYAARRKQPPSIYAQTAHEQARAQEALAALGNEAPARGLDLRRAERLVREARAAARRAGPPVVLPASIRIEHSDLRDLDVAPGSIDLIVTDPPYDRSGLESGAWEALGDLAARALRPGGLLIAYSGQQYLPQEMSALGASGLEYWWTYALLHDRSTGSAQVRQRGLASAWRPVLAYRQPGGDLVPPFTMDLIQGGGREKDSGHPWQQGVPEIIPLIEALCPPGGTVCDPFLGSGTAAVAAVTLGRSVIGCDLDADHVATARARVAEALDRRDMPAEP